MTAIVGASLALSGLSAPANPEGRQRALLEATVREQGDQALAHLTTAGPKVAQEMLDRLEGDAQVRVFLLIDGTLRVGRPEVLSAESRALAQSAGQSHLTVWHAQGSRHQIAVPLHPGAVAVGVDIGRSELVRILGLDNLPLRLVVFALVSGLVCSIMARYLTRRIGTLRMATLRLAEGDLSARVSPQLASVDDEISALGQDIDGLAERIAQLLLAQQRLLRDVSHELRSPLARLQVALALARQRAGPEQAAPLDRIELEAERLGHLVGEVLTLTRLEEAGSPMEFQPVDLAPLLAQIVRDADFEAVNRNRRVLLVRADVPDVVGSEELLQRAIENVVRNAVRFTPEHSSVEVMGTTVQYQHQSVIHIEVRDHGDGVPEAALTDIFRPFHRVGDARDRGSGGTGLGLAIAARAVRLHRGTVVAANAEGGGLRVTLELPYGPET